MRVSHAASSRAASSDRSKHLLAHTLPTHHALPPFGRLELRQTRLGLIASPVAPSWGRIRTAAWLMPRRAQHRPQHRPAQHRPAQHRPAQHRPAHLSPAESSPTEPVANRAVVTSHQMRCYLELLSPEPSTPGRPSIAEWKQALINDWWRCLPRSVTQRQWTACGAAAAQVVHTQLYARLQEPLSD